MDSAASQSIPDCTHRPTCPGCPHFGSAGVAEATLQRLEQLARDTTADLAPVREGTPHGYRHRARLMVRGRARSPKVGLFQAGTHRIADIPNCPIHHPLINSTAHALKSAMRNHQLAPYHDTAHRGLVRAIQVVVERSSQTVQVVVIANSHTPEPCAELLAELSGSLDGSLHSLWWNGNPERTNTVLGPHWSHIRGPETVEERIGGAQVFFPPGAFGQSHLALADRMVDAVHDHVEHGARVAEFYAGCGAIGLGLLARGHAVTFNEVNPAGLTGLGLGIARIEPAKQENARVVSGPAGENHHALAGCDVAIVDPPRKGLDLALRDELAARPPRRLVYVACDLESLCDDALALVAGGRLRLQRLEPYALFPFTNHVETIALFERV